MRFATVIFDVDSTLAALEGVDWLAALRGPDTARTIRELTQHAMDGVVPLDSVYGARLDAIRPTRSEVAQLADAYIGALQPGARDLCTRLKADGVAVHMISGGLRDALLPLARVLGIDAAAAHAVRVEFDNNGKFAGVPAEQLLTQQQGKKALVQALGLARPIAFIGDGATDAEARSVVDYFIAYTGVVRRDSVVAVAHAVAGSMQDIAQLLYGS